MALIERPVGGAGCFEIGGLLIAITGNQPLSHQLRSVSPPLKNRIDPDQRNVPVGLKGMKTGHLFKQEQHFAKLRLGHVLLKEFAYRPVVWLNTWRQPLCDADKITDDISGVMVKRLAAKQSHQWHERVDELKRVRPGPAR